LKMHVRNLGYTLPDKSGAQNSVSRRLRNVTATLTAYVFGTKHDIDNRANALTTTMAQLDFLLHRVKCHELWSTNGLKLDRHFYPPSVNSAFYFIATKRNSTKLCQTVNGKSRKQSAVEWLGSSPEKNFLRLFGFRRLQDLMVNIF